MADFRLKVTAETQDADKKLQRLDKVATEATKDRKLRIDIGDLNKQFSDVGKNVKEASNTIKTFYTVGKNTPVIGERIREVEGLAKGAAALARNAPAATAALQENAKAGSILTNSFEAAGAAAGGLVNNLAKAGFALFAVQQAVGALRGAFGGFFNETIGREIQLRETILKTQTTLASTNKVFRNGTEITDPYQKIVSLTGEVAKRIESIRERSIALAGVTSNDVIEVFGIVASQIGQIGGGLKEAEDLAINFSAALGTFGIPLYQAQQEIGSILRAQITEDSRLATALGIRSADIAKAKTQIGGVVKFLEERLAASVAGQRIAAQGFAGVVSNIQDLAELINQNFGSGLLDPLLGGLTKIFDFLFKIREEVFAIAKGAGQGIGQFLSTNLTAISGGSALFAQIGAGAEGFAAQLTEGVKRAFAALQTDANEFVAPVRNILEELVKSFAVVGRGLAELAKGFISIKTEQFKALISVFSSLAGVVTTFSSALSGVLSAYGQILQVPFVQYLSQIGVQFQLLDRLGVSAALKFVAVAGSIKASWGPIVAFIQAAVARIAAFVGALVIAVGTAFTQIGAIIASFASTLSATNPALATLQTQLQGLAAQFTTTGASAERAGVAMAGFGGATAAAGRLASTAVLSFIKLTAILVGIQVVLAILVDAFGKYQRAQQAAADSARAAQALQDLQTKYKNVTEASDSATKAARDYKQALVDADYQRNLDALEQVREKLNQLRYELKPGIQSWDEFWAALAGSEVGRFEEGVKEQIEKLLKEQKELEGKLNAVNRARDQKAAEDRITLEANNRKNLEKELRDLQRQYQSDVFQERQALAQKEVEIFRTAGELRIKQLEAANKKLIEGEEGASRTALEALNNYIATRERGELDIEASKQTVAIEIANLEKKAADYRYALEQKIFDLRKRAGENEVAAAQARRQLEQATLGGPVPEDVRGRQDIAMRFYMGKGLSRLASAALVGGFTQESQLRSNIVNPESKAEGVGQWLGGRKTAMIQAGARNSFYKQLEFAWQELQTTENASLRALKGAKTLNQALLAAAKFERFDGYEQIGSGTEWGDRIAYTQDLLNRANYGVAPSGANRPQSGANLQGREDLSGDVQGASEYLAAVQGAATALERLRALQAAITSANTKEAFDAIAQSIFTPVALEDLKDSLTEVELTFDAIASASAGAFNTERTAIEVEAQTKRLAAARELAQFEEAVNARTNLTLEEKAKIIEAVRKRQQLYLDSLQKEEQLEKTILATKQASDLIKTFREETQAIYDNVEAQRLRNRLEAEGVAAPLIEAELAKARIRRDLERVQTQLNAGLAEEKRLRDQLAARLQNSALPEEERKRLQAELDAANARIRELEDRLKKLPEEGKKRADAEDYKAANTPDDLQSLLKRWQAEIANTKAIVASLAQTIQTELSTALSGAITSVIDGTTTIGEVFSNFFKNISQAFLKMATEIITKWIVIKAIGLFFGVDTGAAGGGPAPAPVPARAAGGPVVAGMPYLVGEMGPELIVPPGNGTVLTADQTQAFLGGGSAGVNSVVNITVSDSGTKLDETQASMLGRMVDAAVLGVINREKRAGGVLNRR